jgi:tetratricopeptide (TPR) repeat protein
MNTNIIRSLFMLSSKLKVERGQLYQLIRAAESCYCLKDAEGQRELGRILKAFPNPFGAIGDYYEAFYLTRIGQYEESQKNLERTLIYAPEDYKAKALIALSGLEERKMNFDESMRFRLEALKFNKIPLIVESEFGIAILLGRQGEHKHSIKIFESFLPALRLFKGTPLYFDFLNSYAVELAEVGRLYEASNVIQIVVNSPYFSRFLNWRETSDEIERKRYRLRSVVSFKQQKPKNLLQLPEREASESIRRSPFFQPSDVTKLADWKKKMVKEPNGDNDIDENIDEMDDRDLLATLIQIAAKDDVDEEKLRDVVKFAIKTLGLPKQK